MKKDISCKCPACMASEKAKKDYDLPYRYVPGTAQNIFHLSLNLSLPIVGMILIGFSGWIVVPIISFAAAYLANSFIACSACPYHHSDVKTCGCFPKSRFKYKRYRPWGHLDSVIDWVLVVFLLIVPTTYILAVKTDIKSVTIFLLYAVLSLLLLSTFSCPNCRQRSLCYLGKLTLFIRKKQRVI